MSRRPAGGGAAGSSSGSGMEMVKIFKGIPGLIKAEKEGKLGTPQIQNLRSMFFTSAKNIVIFNLSSKQAHPLRNLPNSLNPTLPWNGSRALASEAQYEKLISAAESEMVAKHGQSVVKFVEASAHRPASAAGALSSNVVAVTPPPTSTSTQTSGVSSLPPPSASANASASASAAPSPTAGGAAASPAQTGGGASTGGTTTPKPLNPAQTPTTTSNSGGSAAAGQSSGAPPPQVPGIHTNPAGKTASSSEVFSAKEMRAFVEMDKQRREALFAANPAGREKFSRSVKFWTEGNQNHANANNNRPAVRPGISTSNATGGGVGGGGGGGGGPQARFLAQNPPNAGGGLGMMNRMMPQVPEESVEVRRKRKFGEYMNEVLPGMEVELGVNDILGEVLDNFLMEAASGSVRLAKHRKSDKVELKDIVFYLDKTHKIRVPGFDTQPAEKVRLPPEEKKGRVTRASAAAAKKAGVEGEA